jgi:hypothetical protein
MQHFPKQYIHPVEEKLAALDENYREELSRRTLSSGSSLVASRERSVNNELSGDIKEVIERPEKSIYPTIDESIGYEGDIEQAELSPDRLGEGLYPSL